MKPSYHCPACGTESKLVAGPTQAFCTNENDCRVFTFDPSLPDGGMSNPQFINLDGGDTSPPAGII